jgi:hypothetical protein
MAWRDMQPGSEFLESIYAKKMPPAVDHYLSSTDFSSKGFFAFLTCRPENTN